PGPPTDADLGGSAPRCPAGDPSQPQSEERRRVGVSPPSTPERPLRSPGADRGGVSRSCFITFILFLERSRGVRSPGHRDYTSPRTRSTSGTVATGGASFRRIQSSSRGPVSECEYSGPPQGYTEEHFYKEDISSASVLKGSKTHTHSQAHATVDSLAPTGLCLRGFDWKEIDV